MPRYIKLDDAIEIAKDYAKVRLQLHDWSGQAVAEDIAEELRNLPVADVEEIRHGKWEDYGSFYAYFRCSKCGYISPHFSYCPNCGAKMDGEIDK